MGYSLVVHRAFLELQSTSVFEHSPSEEAGELTIKCHNWPSVTYISGSLRGRIDLERPNLHACYTFWLQKAAENMFSYQFGVSGNTR